MPPAPKEKKKGGCFKWGGIAAGAVVVLAVAASLTGGGDADSGGDSKAASLFGSDTAGAVDSGAVENAVYAEDSGAVISEQQGNTEIQEKQDEKVPTEHKNALRKAEIYANRMHMSKAGIYDQLTSEYGEKFSTEAAQYAMNSLEADWNKNTLEKARIYQDSMAMSPDAIYEQLTSEYGEQFTPEEVQYAVDNL